MSELETRFHKAAEDVQTLPEKPDNETLLKLYALYKQATTGDVTGKRPGLTDFAGRAKYDAWKKLEGTPKENAMQEYVDLVDKLMNQ